MAKILKKLKPESVVAVIDTRERLILDLNPLKTVRGTLSTGDISVRGLEHKIAVERKTLQDMIGCIGRDRERFEREMQRILAYPVRGIFIEGSWGQIELQLYRGQVHPSAVMGSLLGWMTRGIPIVFCDNHEAMGKMVGRFLYLAAQRFWSESHEFIQLNLEGD